MLRQILTSSVFAGACVGVIAAVLQLWLVTPLLMEGELYESGARVHFGEGGTPQSPVGSPNIWEDPMRHIWSAGFSIVAYTGYAFLLVAGMALAARSGTAITPRSGLIWGLCAFLAVVLAPAAGMSPELPGTIRAEVELRQMWWAITVICSVVGLALIAFGRGLAAILAAIVLLAAPHIVGAPGLDTYWGVAAPELAGEYAARVLATSAITWTLLGGLAAYFWTRSEE